jgi:hypothetical protein
MHIAGLLEKRNNDLKGVYLRGHDNRSGDEQPAIRKEVIGAEEAEDRGLNSFLKQTS